MSTQSDIIKALNVLDYQDDTQRIIRERVDFLKDELKLSQRSSFILGISGGVDSLTAALLAQQAVKELRADDYECSFIAVKLPFAVQVDEKFVDKALKVIQPDDVRYANIQSIVDQVEHWVDDPISKHDDYGKDFIRGNIKARTRMIVQYALANSLDGLVIGTDHAAEAVTGFFTKHGDGACDIAPLYGLVKQTVRNIAEHYGAEEELFDKVATADLEDLRANIPDEDVLGVSYKDIDAFLMGESVPERVESKIIERYNSTEHKRHSPTVPEQVIGNVSTIQLAYKVFVDDMEDTTQKYVEMVNDYCKDNKIKINDFFDDIEKVCEVLNTLEEEYPDGTHQFPESFANWLHNLKVDDAFKILTKQNRFIGIQYDNVIECTNDYDGMMKLLDFKDVYHEMIMNDVSLDNYVVDLLQPINFYKV